MSATPNLRKPGLVVVIGNFTTLHDMRGATEIQALFNPSRMFSRVLVISVGDDGELSKHDFGSVRVELVPTLSRRRAWGKFDDLGALVRALPIILNAVGRGGYDLLAQTWDTPIKYGVPVVVAGRISGKPTVVTLCNDYRRLEALTYSRVKRFFASWLWRFVLGSASIVRSKSLYIASFAIEHGVPSERVHVVPNKERVGKFGNLAEEEISSFLERHELTQVVRNRVTFLSVGRLIPAKNHARCLQALAMARQKGADVCYLIVGRGPLEEDLKRLVKELGVSDVTRFLGYFDHGELGRAYQSADVLLFPTLFEGQPRVVLEAMLAGLPIICSDYGNVCDIVRDGIDGVWTDPLSTESIAAAIRHLAEDADARARMGRHDAFDSSLYSFEHVDSLEVRMYEAALSSGHATGGIRGTLQYRPSARKNTEP